MNFIISHLYIFTAICFAIVSQLIIKWRMSLIDELPEKMVDKILLLSHSLFDPFIIISIALTIMAGISWMLAMTKFDISYAYPFIALSFVLILVFSSLLFQEPITVYKVIGIIFIITGIIISSKSM